MTKVLRLHPQGRVSSDTFGRTPLDVRLGFMGKRAHNKILVPSSSG